MKLSEAREILSPHSNAYLRVLHGINRMPDEEVARLLTASEKMSQTNCGWYEFQAAQIVIAEIGREQAYRARKAAGLKALEEG